MTCVVLSKRTENLYNYTKNFDRVLEVKSIAEVSKTINSEDIDFCLIDSQSFEGMLDDTLKTRDENTKLNQKIEDIRIIDRAKLVLISYLKMTEDEAHKYIEKQAMNTRRTRRAVAESVLKTYER
ncbi:MAG: ANTAR domain-containing protein [Clostridiales bacterium]|jgi:response regulator NasT|nr:ANTAR domain-containing protein [Clostridiales bacterium]